MQQQEKVALVTGVGIALALAEAGFTVAISGRRTAEQVQPALDEIRQYSSRSIYVKADVSSAADRLWLLANVGDQLGRLDVLVNNAGIAPRVRADLLDAGEESFDEII
jgi:NAD(P)-dependent dehydrogenase (short-subunit alcohol dehydrogenase family)